MLFVCPPPHPSLPLTKATDTAPRSWVALTSPTNRMPGRFTKAVQSPSRRTLDALAVFGIDCSVQCTQGIASRLLAGVVREYSVQICVCLKCSQGKGNSGCTTELFSSECVAPPPVSPGFARGQIQHWLVRNSMMAAVKFAGLCPPYSRPCTGRSHNRCPVIDGLSPFLSLESSVILAEISRVISYHTPVVMLDQGWGSSWRRPFHLDVELPAAGLQSL